MLYFLNSCIDFHQHKPQQAGHPNNVIFLSCDAFGILPPIAKLSSGQAMYQFLSGYTAKVAGTERGIKEPTATFSTCFGAAFMTLHPTRYADLLQEKLIEGVKEKQDLFQSLLQHPKIKAVRNCGLMIAVEFESFEMNKQIIDELIKEGVFTDWFLFAANCLRIVPPLTISTSEITMACKKIIKAAGTV